MSILTALALLASVNKDSPIKVNLEKAISSSWLAQSSQRSPSPDGLLQEMQFNGLHHLWKIYGYIKSYVKSFSFNSSLRWPTLQKRNIWEREKSGTAMAHHNTLAIA
jgi:hypothetical protein